MHVANHQIIRTTLFSSVNLMKVWTEKAMLVSTRLNLQRTTNSTTIQIMTWVFFGPLRHLHLQSRSRRDAKGSSWEGNIYLSIAPLLRWKLCGIYSIIVCIHADMQCPSQTIAAIIVNSDFLSMSMVFGKFSSYRAKPSFLTILTFVLG